MKLKQALKEAGWTQKVLAKKLGVSTPAVNHWVKGNAAIPKSRVQQIQSLLGVGDISAMKVDYETLLSDARTRLSYTVLWGLTGVEGVMPGTPTRSAARYKRRMLLLSRGIGVSQGSLEQALFGTELLTAVALNKLGELTGFNPAVWYEGCEGAYPVEADAVTAALTNAMLGGKLTFINAQKELTQGRTEYMTAELQAVDGESGLADVPLLLNTLDVDWWLAGGYPPAKEAPAITTRNEGRYESAQMED